MTGADRVELHAQTSTQELARVVREHAARLATALMRVTGDFASAEDRVCTERSRCAMLGGRRLP